MITDACFAEGKELKYAAVRWRKEPPLAVRGAGAAQRRSLPGRPGFVCPCCAAEGHETRVLTLSIPDSLLTCLSLLN